MTRLYTLTRGAKSAPQFSPSVYTSALSSAASRPSSVLKALVWASQQGSIKSKVCPQNGPNGIINLLGALLVLKGTGDAYVGECEGANDSFATRGLVG